MAGSDGPILGSPYHLQGKTSAANVFLSDLETVVNNQKLPKKCEVSDPVYQDKLLAQQYPALPNLRCVHVGLVSNFFHGNPSDVEDLWCGQEQIPFSLFPFRSGNRMSRAGKKGE